MLFVFVCELWCPTHIVLCFCFVCFRLVYPVLPASLDCPFLIAPSVFSSVYLHCNVLYFFQIQLNMINILLELQIQKKKVYGLGSRTSHQVIWYLMAEDQIRLTGTIEVRRLTVLQYEQMSNYQLMNTVYKRSHMCVKIIHDVIYFIYSCLWNVHLTFFGGGWEDFFQRGEG